MIFLTNSLHPKSIFITLNYYGLQKLSNYQQVVDVSTQIAVHYSETVVD